MRLPGTLSFQWQLLWGYHAGARLSEPHCDIVHFNAL